MQVLAGTENTEFRVKTLSILCSFLFSLEAHNITSVGKGHCQALATQYLKSCGGQKELQCFELTF